MVGRAVQGRVGSTGSGGLCRVRRAVQGKEGSVR